MKKTIAMLSCVLTGVLLSTSCSNKEEDVLETSYPYTFSGFEITSGYIDELSTRSAEATAYSLLVVDVVNDTYVQKVERLSSQDALTDVTLDLTLGSHKIYFVCGKSAWANFDESALSVSWNESAALGETWAAEIPVEVNGPAVAAQKVDLGHAVAYTRIRLTDAIPAEASYFTQTLVGGSWTYNLLTQSGGTATTVTRQVTIPSEYIGQKEVSFGIFSFVPAGVTKAESYTVTAYDKDHTPLASHTFADVPIAAKRYETYKGQFFPTQSANSGFQVTLSDDWTENVTEF